MDTLMLKPLPTPRKPVTLDPNIDRIYVLTMRTPGLRTDSWLSAFAAQEADLTFRCGLDAESIEQAMGDGTLT